MSGQPPHPISPPPVPVSPPSTGVRRHHTITATSRRNARNVISEEGSQEQQLWHDDEPVDEDWVGGVGAVGEKTSLHRQSSLPTKYARGIHGKSARQPGNLTPRTMNSLTAIAGHEGDEEDWENEMRGYPHEDGLDMSNDPAQHQQVIDAQAQSQSGNPSPLSPHFGAPNAPSPPLAASGVRRHQSLTYGAQGNARQMPAATAAAGLRRAGTLQATGRHPSAMGPTPHSPSPPNEEEQYEYEEDLVNPYEDESYFNSRSPPPGQQQYQGQVQSQGMYAGSLGRSPWNTPGSAFSPGSSSSIDDVQRALSALEFNNSNQIYTPNTQYGTGNQASYPPRFNNNGNGGQVPSGLRPGNGHPAVDNGRKLQLVTDLEGKPASVQSAAPYVPQVGGHQQQQQQRVPGDGGDHALTAGGTNWEQKDKLIGGRTSNPNLNYGYKQGQQGNIPNVPPIPQQYLNQNVGGQAPRLGQQQQQQQQTAFGQQAPLQQTQGEGGGQPLSGFIGSPIDVPSLIAVKGYNPTQFDTRPAFARYFVIKSYTEDDVHKSLKYEIWSSTDPGNKRLDKAFKELAGRGPIYLFFSVNASGHFCGMAEMLTPVDYTRSSTVWASDKWKGVFKVRWIFVRDIPNMNLRHIRLNNTQERKPVTNSRDTQELLPEAGQEMLRIFHTHPARTSLLQDFAFYELQAMQKVQAQQGGESVAPSQGPPSSPPQQQQQQQQVFAMGGMGNPASMYGGMSPQMNGAMSPAMLQMQMGMMSPQFGMPQNQTMQQSVMRNTTSPGPPGGQSYMNVPY
ncbi:YTH-domain-containing protein [Coniophora puteana RWD-64-598 SS2]|uniref:YTH-domain-containing protein n=1 Tax=Coniophora puteana (strain RWD-64-598) TaxID=741705 RepID=A0A5M3N1C9_CONPW|nr:YTH-domain-containing protein [Coniophora puteana RWD-64-598 SS2]EIW84824.1 YTH-domain-containing protein [Coniophora puteana RWD-64-598 SS2]